MTGTLRRLYAQMEAFSPAERRVAEYFLSHADSLVGTSIAEVAAVCETGKPSVVRLCKRAGFTGYKDFCIALRSEQVLERHVRAPEFTDLHPGATTGEICSLVAQKSVQTIEHTLALLDVQAMEQAANSLLNARRIALFAMGGSGIVAEDAQNKFKRLGLQADFSQDAHYQLQAAALLQRQDAAVFISYHGRTKELVEMMDIARESGPRLIALTKHGQNPVSDGADIRLHVASDEPILRAGAMTSRLAMLAVVDMLHTCMASRPRRAMRQALERTAEVADKRRVGV